MRRVLILSRNYPNEAVPSLGPWVEGLARHLCSMTEVRVVAPVPYCPPLPRALHQARFRRIPRLETRHGIAVSHPRFLTGPGYSTHVLDATTFHHAARREVDRIRAAFPFDLIHGHFGYPDGVVAVRLGARYGVPALITEHAPWRPWMDHYPIVRRQATAAAGRCALQVAVSRAVLTSIAEVTGDERRIRVIPVGFDANVFFPSPRRGAPDPDQILFVGRVHAIKGVDLLLAAMCRLIRRRPRLRLVVAGGGSAYRHYRREEERLRRLALNLGLGTIVTFLGPQPPGEVAQLMRQSALLVLPSRLESFGVVLVEALACGTPVVATRCGGPEDIVSDEVGVLVPTEDPDALAGGIELVLARRASYESLMLGRYARENFSWDVVTEKYLAAYRAVLEGQA